MSLYASDGSINISVVDGSTYTGLQASDGSYYVVVSDGSTWRGTHHPCGGWWVTVSPTNNNYLYASDGSYNVSETPFTNNGMHVTVVSGSLTPVVAGSPTYYIYGF